MDNIKKKFLISVKWTSILKIGQSILQFATSIVLARLISPDEFGRFVCILALIEGLALITGFGISTSILQNQKYPENEFQNTGFFLSIFLIITFCLVAGSLGFWLASENILFYLTILFGKCVFMLSGVHGILLQKEHRFKVYFGIEFIVFIISSVVAIILAIKGYELTALIAQYVTLQVLTSTLVISFSSFRPTLHHFFNKDYALVFYKNGRELFASQMVEKLLVNVDKIVINNFLGPANLAFYNRAISLPQRFQSLPITILQPLLTVTFAKLQSDKESSGYLFNTAVWLLLRTSLFITLVIVCASEEVVLILYGDTWLFAAHIIPLIFVFVALWPIRTLSRNFLLSSGYFTKLRKIQFVELFLFLGFMLPGGYYWKIEGVSIGISAWILAAVAIYMGNIRMIITLEWRRLFLLPLALSITILSLNHVVGEYLSLFNINIYSTALINSILVLFIYAFGLVVFERKHIKMMTKQIIS